MESYNKLVRDGIPKKLDEKGVPYEMSVVEGEELRVRLMEKLSEEVGEFSESGGSIEELADVIEVVSALKKLPEYERVDEVARLKREERGGFEKGIVLKGEK